ERTKTRPRSCPPATSTLQCPACATMGPARAPPETDFLHHGEDQDGSTNGGVKRRVNEQRTDTENEQAPLTRQSHTDPVGASLTVNQAKSRRRCEELAEHRGRGCAAND